MATKLDGLYSGPGRLVMGSLTTKGDKDHTGQPIPVADQRYFFGVAVRKDDPHFGALWQKLYTMAATDYGHAPMVMQQIQMGLNARDFSWKIDDGDVPKVDTKTGQLRPIPEYAKGCFILKFSSSFETNCCDEQNRDITRESIKRGDYVDVVFSSQINGKMDTQAGIYFNPTAVRRIAFGEAIATGVSAQQAFGGMPPAVAPPGSSPVPVASGMPAVHSPAPAPQPQQYAPAPQPQQYAPAPQPQQYAAPLSAPAPMPAGFAGMPGMPAPVGAPQPTAYPVNPAPYPAILNPGQ